MPGLPGIRVDSGVRTGGEVSVYYDPMLAKVIAHAPTRSQAARLLARALAESRILGVVTNRDLLVGILREDEFNRGLIDTGYLTRHDPLELSAVSADQIPVHALAVSLADQAARRAEAGVLGAAPSGWRNVPNARQTTTLMVGERPVDVDYRVLPDHVEASVDGVELEGVIAHACAPDRVDLQAAGVRRTVAVARRGQDRFADSGLGSTMFSECIRFPEPSAQSAPGSLVAPMPGTVIRVEAVLGQVVAAGTVVVVLEAMKMEHPVKAPHTGTVVELDAKPGQAVELGTVLAVVSQDPAA